MKKMLLLPLVCLAPNAWAAGDAELRINGHITAAVAAQMHTALAHGPRTIRISSTGGEQQPALAIARDLRHAHASLIVEGLCGGPCANYLFPAAVRRTVSPGGLVIFSGTATSALAMVPTDKTSLVGDDYAKTAAEEKTLIAEAGINPALLLEPQLQLHPGCVSLTSKDAAGKSYINYRADFIGWVPSRSYLARAGVRVDGFWPANPVQFQTAFQNAFAGGARGAIASFGPASPAKPASLMAALKSVRACDASGH
ncbi:MAG TPA: hypothetical protein VGI89_10040 [Rhizomicrobium sp.]